MQQCIIWKDTQKYGEEMMKIIKIVKMIIDKMDYAQRRHDYDRYLVNEYGMKRPVTKFNIYELYRL